MKISQDFSIEYESESLHIKIGPFNGRSIEKHQEDAGHGEDDEEEAGDSSEAEGVGEPEAMALHLCREEMEEKVVEDQHRSFQIGIRHSGSEDRSPDRRVCDPLEHSLFHLFLTS